MNAYAGVTKDQLNQYVRAHGKHYDSTTHEGKRDELMQRVRQQLSRSAGGHLTEDDTKSIVKHIGIDDVVDVSRMKLDDALQLHSIYQNNDNNLTADHVKRLYRQNDQAAPVYLKKKKKAD